MQSVATSSGIPSIGMIVTLPAVAMPPLASMPVIGRPQVTSISMSGPTLGPTPFGGPQSNQCVSFGSVFDASSGQGGNGENSGNGGNGGIVGSRTIQVQPQRASTFNLGTKPKDPTYFSWTCQ